MAVAGVRGSCTAGHAPLPLDSPAGSTTAEAQAVKDCGSHTVSSRLPRLALAVRDGLHTPVTK